MLEEDPIGVEEVDALLKAEPLLHRTHFAFLNGVEVRREGRREGGRGWQEGHAYFILFPGKRNKKEMKRTN